MLSESFIDWWFAPWRYAAATPPGLPPCTDPLAQRDQYRHWCRAAAVRADLPAHPDGGWQVAAIDAAPELLQAGALFGGLFAARVQDRRLLDALSEDDRRWCLAVALTQPLKPCGDLAFAGSDSTTVRGLAELARRLEPALPGAWSRLRLMLLSDAALTARLDSLLAATTITTITTITTTITTTAAPAVAGSAAALRLQRCWQLCRTRAAGAAPT